MDARRESAAGYGSEEMPKDLFHYENDGYGTNGYGEQSSALIGQQERCGQSENSGYHIPRRIQNFRERHGRQNGVRHIR